jgi:cytosine/adenosine deaminase-related metal-dependent hydrolase
LDRLRVKVDGFRREETATLRVGVSPHAPFTVSRTLYQMTAEYARKESLRMTAHIAESREETLLVRDGAGPFGDGQRNRGIEVAPRGCTPIAYLESLGVLGRDMLLIHAIETDERDLDLIRASGSVVVHCPKSNAKLGHRTAHAAEMRAKGTTVALGTDSVASNNVADMFEEMRTAVFHQRMLTGRINALTARDAFGMATIDGARVLGLDAHLGSLEAGKRADFVVVDLGEPATQPVYDPIETMVYSGSRSDVRATFLGGTAVSIDDSEILDEALEIADRLRMSF